MFARVSTLTGDMTDFMTHFASAAPVLEQWSGLDHIHMLVDEQNGRAIAVSVWADEESMKRSDAGADEVRDRVVGLSGITTESVEFFRLARTIRGPASTLIAPGR
jgi:heme-degrading monooxygenase HmoA